MRITGKLEFWFERNALRPIDLNPILNEFWFGTLWQDIREAHVGKLVLALDRPGTKPPASAAELLISKGLRASHPPATPRDRTGQHQFPHMSH